MRELFVSSQTAVAGLQATAVPDEALSVVWQLVLQVVAHVNTMLS